MREIRLGRGRPHHHVIGDEHPDTLLPEENLAIMLSKIDEREAATLQRHVYEARKRDLGEDHPYTADAHYIWMTLKAGHDFSEVPPSNMA